MSDINKTTGVVEEFVRTFEANGAKAVDVTARPSGDDIDVIKVWVDLGPASVDAHDWSSACEEAIRKSDLAAGFRVQVRAEKL